MKGNIKKIKSPLKLIMSFTDRDVGKDIEEYLASEHMNGGIVLRGKGTAESNIADIFGFGIDDKDIIATLIPTNKVDKILANMRKISGIEKDNYGLIFVIDLQSASSNLLEYLDIKVGN